MNTETFKKWILPNFPYLFFVYLFDKAAQAYRLAPGIDFSGKFLSLGKGFTAAFVSAAPSFAPLDIFIGIAGAALIRLIIYIKGKNAKNTEKARNTVPLVGEAKKTLNPIRILSLGITFL